MTLARAAVAACMMFAGRNDCRLRLPMLGTLTCPSVPVFMGYAHLCTRGRAARTRSSSMLTSGEAVAFAPATTAAVGGPRALRMAQEPPPAKLELPKAKLEAAAVNAKQWGTGAGGSGTGPDLKTMLAKMEADRQAAEEAAAKALPQAIEEQEKMAVCLMPRVSCPARLTCEVAALTSVGWGGLALVQDIRTSFIDKLNRVKTAATSKLG